MEKEKCNGCISRNMEYCNHFQLDRLMNTKEQEEYLFKVAKMCLDYFEVEYTKEELVDLVMMRLFNIK